jgi:hypothetical protein
MLSFGSSSWSCEAPIPLHPTDILKADIVVEAHIQNYQTVVDAAATARTKLFIGPISRMQPYVDDISTLYGRFDASFEHVFQGKTSKRAIVYWLRGADGPGKALPPGQYILGLERADKFVPTKYYDPPLAPNSWLVVEKACPGAFIFPSSAEIARKVVQLFGPQP